MYKCTSILTQAFMIVVLKIQSSEIYPACMTKPAVLAHPKQQGINDAFDFPLYPPESPWIGFLNQP